MEDGKAQLQLENWKSKFFIIWSAQLFSLLGSNLVSFALIWWLTKTTGSATVLAMASLFGLLPQVVLGPIVGTLVDRWNRRVIMILADASIAIATLGIALLFWLGDVQVWQIYLLTFLRSVAGGFHWPAMQASTTLMVPKEHLSRIQGMNSMVGGGMNIISAPLGALLIEILPLQGVLGIDVVTALIAITPLFFIAIPQPERSSARSESGLSEPSSVWQDFKAGLSYVIQWKGLMMIGGIAIIINFLLNPAFSLMPILVTGYFKGGVLQLAWMNSAWGFGVVAGGLVLGVWGGFKRHMTTSLLGLLGMGLGVSLLAFAPSNAYVLGLVGMFLGAFFNPIANGPLMAAVQTAVPPEMQGRVFSLIGSLAQLMVPIGLMIAGPVSDAIGIQTWFMFGAVGLFILGGGAFFIPAIVNFEDGRPGNGVQHTSTETKPLEAASDL